MTRPGSRRTSRSRRSASSRRARAVRRPPSLRVGSPGRPRSDAGSGGAADEGIGTVPGRRGPGRLGVPRPGGLAREGVRADPRGRRARAPRSSSSRRRSCPGTRSGSGSSRRATRTRSARSTRSCTRTRSPSPGPETTRLGRGRPRTCGVTVAIGVNERNARGQRRHALQHAPVRGPGRSMLAGTASSCPTAGERLVWGQGDGSDLEVYDLPVRPPGRPGVLGELHASRPRTRLSRWGQQIHVAPTWDHGEPWTSTMRHLAKEGRCVVVGCCQAFHVDDIPDRFAFKQAYLGDVDGWINPGQSVIVDPGRQAPRGPGRRGRRPSCWPRSGRSSWSARGGSSTSPATTPVPTCSSSESTGGRRPR